MTSMPFMPFFIGHRGCAYESENTLKAIKKAIDLGVDGIANNKPDIVVDYLKKRILN